MAKTNGNAQGRMTITKAQVERYFRGFAFRIDGHAYCRQIGNMPGHGRLFFNESAFLPLLERAMAEKPHAFYRIYQNDQKCVEELLRHFSLSVDCGIPLYMAIAKTRPEERPELCREILPRIITAVKWRLGWKYEFSTERSPKIAEFFKKVPPEIWAHDAAASVEISKEIGRAEHNRLYFLSQDGRRHFATVEADHLNIFAEENIALALNQIISLKAGPASLEEEMEKCRDDLAALSASGNGQARSRILRLEEKLARLAVEEGPDAEGGGSEKKAYWKENLEVLSSWARIAEEVKKIMADITCTWQEELDLHFTNIGYKRVLKESFRSNRQVSDVLDGRADPATGKRNALAPESGGAGITFDRRPVERDGWLAFRITGGRPPGLKFGRGNGGKLVLYDVVGWQKKSEPQKFSVRVDLEHVPKISAFMNGIGIDARHMQRYEKRIFETLEKIGFASEEGRLVLALKSDGGHAAIVGKTPPYPVSFLAGGLPARYDRDAAALFLKALKTSPAAGKGRKAGKWQRHADFPSCLRFGICVTPPPEFHIYATDGGAVVPASYLNEVWELRMEMKEMDRGNSKSILGIIDTLEDRLTQKF